MNLTLFKIYGITLGAFWLIVGFGLLFLKRLDTILADKEIAPDRIKSTRIIISIMAIIGGLSSISAVLFGWPPIMGYVIPPK